MAGVAGQVFGYSILPSLIKSVRCEVGGAGDRSDPYLGMGRVEIGAPGAILEADFGAIGVFRYLTWPFTIFLLLPCCRREAVFASSSVRT